MIEPVGYDVRHLERMLLRVGAWCRRAAAEAWDSGRLSPTGAPSPGSEVAAILSHEARPASPALTSARAEALQREQAYDKHHAAAPWLAALVTELGLSRLEWDVLTVIAAPALWGELGRVYAVIAGTTERWACDEVVVGQILGVERAPRLLLALALAPDAALVRQGLVQVGAGPRPIAPLEIDPQVLRLLLGEPRVAIATAT